MNPLPEEAYGQFSQRVFNRTATTPRPIKAQFEITYRCNIHCVHCYTDPFNNPSDLRRELTFPEIVHLLDQMAAVGVLWITLTGGEAMVHPQFRQIYQAAKDRGFIVSLYSNGTTLTDSMLDFLCQDSPFQLEVSIHGVTRQTFEAITQVPGSYDWAIPALRKVLERGLPLRIKTKAMTLNQAEMPEIQAFIENLGLEFNLNTDIYPRLNGDLSSTTYRLSPEDAVNLEFGGTPDLGCGNPGSHPNPSERNPTVARETPQDDRMFRCGCGTNTITINPYGKLRACTFTTWPELDLRQMPLGQAYDQMVSTISQAQYGAHTPCQQCPVYALCDKNPVMAVHEVGSMQAPVPHFCDVAYGRQARMDLEATRG